MRTTVRQLYHTKLVHVKFSQYMFYSVIKPVHCVHVYCYRFVSGRWSDRMCPGQPSVGGPPEDRTSAGGRRRGSYRHVEPRATLEPRETWVPVRLGLLHDPTKTCMQGIQKSGWFIHLKCNTLTNIMFNQAASMENIISAHLVVKRL